MNIDMNIDMNINNTLTISLNLHQPTSNPCGPFFRIIYEMHPITMMT